MTKQKAMHLQLMEVCGKMYTCDLPAVSTGRFQFSQRKDGTSDIPLYITAENEEWILHATGGTELFRGEEKLGRETALNPEELLGVRFDGRAFVLYGEETRENDRVFLHYIPADDAQEITIGRSADSAVYYENRYVGRHHATLLRENGGWTVRDEESVNGTFVNGNAVQRAELHAGDSICILGLYILIGAGFMAINNGHGRFGVLESVLKQADEGPAEYEQPAEPSEEPMFNRHPRRKFQLEPEPIEISMPPAPMQGNKLPLTLRLSNPALMGARAIANGNALMALTSMAVPFAIQGVTEKDRAEVRRLTAEYRALYAEAYEKLRQAKALHDELEAVYRPYVDFGALTAYTEECLNGLFEPIP